MTKTDLYSIYVKETSGDTLAKSTFFEHINNYFGPYREDKSFPQVRFSKYSSHSVCDICLALNNFRKTSKTEKDMSIALEAKRLHQQNFSGARRAYPLFLFSNNSSISWTLKGAIYKNSYFVNILFEVWIEDICRILEIIFSMERVDI